MTINQMRQKLGRIMEPLFSLEEYQQTYTMIASQITDEGEIAATVHRYADHVDSFVAVLGEHVGDKRMLYNIVMISNPLVLYSFFVRYHLITQHLIASDQAAERSAPTRNREFLTEVFVDLWREIDV